MAKTNHLHTSKAATTAASIIRLLCSGLSDEFPQQRKTNSPEASGPCLQYGLLCSSFISKETSGTAPQTSPLSPDHRGTTRGTGSPHRSMEQTTCRNSSRAFSSHRRRRRSPHSLALLSFKHSARMPFVYVIPRLTVWCICIENPYYPVLFCMFDSKTVWLHRLPTLAFIYQKIQLYSAYIALFCVNLKSRVLTKGNNTTGMTFERSTVRKTHLTWLKGSLSSNVCFKI